MLVKKKAVLSYDSHPSNEVRRLNYGRICYNDRVLGEVGLPSVSGTVQWRGVMARCNGEV